MSSLPRAPNVFLPPAPNVFLPRTPNVFPPPPPTSPPPPPPPPTSSSPAPQRLPHTVAPTSATPHVKHFLPALALPPSFYSTPARLLALTPSPDRRPAWPNPPTGRRVRALAPGGFVRG
ncbi:hypothetical protein B0H16DRAFT_1722627 [Mycena metata]|uniref:Uncharacterized protein n=1 Tax=Mycena metata TaxID=1033252 RepID=A0AAD7NC27_9AGAR|nr:hypothetical protein B0H16DRAFT_1722627 [Mycena metata]